MTSTCTSKSISCSFSNFEKLQTYAYASTMLAIAFFNLISLVQKYGDVLRLTCTKKIFSDNFNVHVPILDRYLLSLCRDLAHVSAFPNHSYASKQQIKFQTDEHVQRF